MQATIGMRATVGWRCWWLMFVLMAGVLPNGAMAEDAGSTLFEDKFAAALDPGWSWVPKDEKTWKIDSGVLEIRTSHGGLWMKNNNATSMLLRTPPEAKGGTLAVEVFVENEPTGGYENAGLIWYLDDDSYVALNKELLSKQSVQFISETASKPKVGFAEAAYQPKTVWLRMLITGNKAKGQYRETDKDDWKTLGECDIPPGENPKVGLLTGYAPKNTEHWSRFSKFRIYRP